MPSATPVIYTSDSNSLAIIGISLAMLLIPVMTELSPPFYMSEPFAVDDTWYSVSKITELHSTTLDSSRTL